MIGSIGGYPWTPILLAIVIVLAVLILFLLEMVEMGITCTVSVLVTTLIAYRICWPIPPSEYDSPYDDYRYAKLLPRLKQAYE